MDYILDQPYSILSELRKACRVRAYQQAVNTFMSSSLAYQGAKQDLDSYFKGLEPSDLRSDFVKAASGGEAPEKKTNQVVIPPFMTMR